MQYSIHKFAAGLLLFCAIILLQWDIAYAWGRRPSVEVKTESREPIQPQVEIVSPPRSAPLKGQPAAAGSRNPGLPKNTLEIQQALKNCGYDPGPLDSKMGPRTRRAIRQFQKDNELKVDGMVGPKTWQKLKTFLSPKQEGGA